MTDPVRAELHRRAGIELARRSLWYFCQVMAPDFYTDDRPYLRNVCETLQSFYESDDRVLVMCMPPRHGKSRTAGLFTEWVFGHDVGAHVITVSYNEELSTTFAKTVRNAIQEVKTSEEVTVYSDVFPDTRIKPGSASMKLWGLEGGRGEHSYLATSVSGTATGYGANLLILDDTIRSSEEAYNEKRLQQLWDYFVNTLMSRREVGMKIVIIMTRWATGDMAGRALEHFRHIGVPVRQVLYKARQEDGSMLCPSILSEEDYRILLETQDKGIVMANYQQEPLDIKGRLYSGFRTYSEIPPLLRVLAYCDTADEGTDYLCSIVFGVPVEAPQDAVILDVIYTQEPMEYTEPLVAEQLMREYGGLPVSIAQVESNNGGRGFARAVAEILKRERSSTVIGWFTQTRNKRARILTAAPWLMQHVSMPGSWAERWPDWWHHVVTFTREGKAEHDDAEDALTGVCELMTAVPKSRRAVIRPKRRRDREPLFINPPPLVRYMSILPTYRAGYICIPWWYGLGYPLVYLTLGIAIGISRSDTMAIALSNEAIIALLVCALAGAIIYNVLYSLSKYREQQLDAAKVYEKIVSDGRNPSEPGQLTAQEKWDLQKVQRFDPVFMGGIIVGVILATACAVAISWFYLYRWVGTEWYEWAALGFIISLIAAWFLNETVVKLVTSGLWSKVATQAFQGVTAAVAENPETVTLLDEYVQKFIAGGFSKKDALKKAQEYLAAHPELIK